MTEEGRAAECLAALARTGAPHSSHPSARHHGLALSVEGAAKDFKKMGKTFVACFCVFSTGTSKSRVLPAQRELPSYGNLAETVT